MRQLEPEPVLIVAAALLLLLVVLLTLVIIAPVGLAVLLIGNPEPSPSSLRDASTGQLVQSENEGTRP